jgi:hypothetical protein
LVLSFSSFASISLISSRQGILWECPWSCVCVSEVDGCSVGVARNVRNPASSCV